MGRGGLYPFILRGFGNLFFNIFSILFLITSLVFIVMISNMTVSIKISLKELGTLYLLIIPQVLFISLSVSYFLAGISTFNQLSRTQELVALTAGGISPNRIIAPMGVIGGGLVVINLLFLFLSIPYAHNRFSNLKELKKQEAQFNFQRGHLSQQLGEWQLFIQKGSEKEYREIYLYNPTSSQFVVAHKGELKNRGSYLQLRLKKGNLYKFDSNLTASFKQMVINHPLQYSSLSLLDLKKYWQENGKFIVSYLPVALLPLALLWFIPTIAFYHPRLHSNRKPLMEGIGILGVYLLLSQENRELWVSFLIPFSFLIISIILYKKRIIL